MIPTVGDSAPAELTAAQELTLNSVERALRSAPDDLEIDVRAVRFPDEPVEVSWLTDMPTLHRSVLDLGEFGVARRLPLLCDVLDGFGDASEFDVAILTNVDIAPQPFFYELVADLRRDGTDAASITRRTVHARHSGSTWSELAAQPGSHHPGDDCFVFDSKLLPRIHPVEVALGARWVARSLLWQLMLIARSFRHIGDLHATFHLGDDRAWGDPRLTDYDRFNQARVHQLVRQLVDDHGIERVRHLPTAKPFVAAIEHGTEPVVPPPTGRFDKRARRRPYTGGNTRFIFSANAGRSGSQYLATLLDASPDVSAGHEREPAMAGGWLRRVSYRDPGASFEARRIKADAIRAETERLPGGTVYADSSHMFVKTFADVVFDEFQHELISVVVLRRDPMLVAKSFFELDYLGPVRKQWIDWMIPPTAPQSTFPMRHDDVRSEFDLIFGYLVDVATRTRRLRDRTPVVNWVDARLEDITQPTGARELFNALEVRPPADLVAVTTQQVNEKATVKSDTSKIVALSEVREHWTDFCHRFESRPDLQSYVDELEVTR